MAPCHLGHRRCAQRQEPLCGGTAEGQREGGVSPRRAAWTARWSGGIQLHQQGGRPIGLRRRPRGTWIRVLERYPEGGCFFDCVGSMVTNLMLDAEPDYDGVSMARIEEIEAEIFVGSIN